MSKGKIPYQSQLKYYQKRDVRKFGYSSCYFSIFLFLFLFIVMPIRFIMMFFITAESYDTS